MTPQKHSPNKKWLDHLAKQEQNKLERLNNSMFVKELKEVGKEKGIEWSIDTGKSLFAKI